MFFINSLLPVDQQTLEDSILSIAGEKDESRKDSLEGRLVAIIKEITDEGGLDRFVEWSIKTGMIRDRFNLGRPIDKHVSPQWIGKRLKSMSFNNRIIHGYSEIRITAEEYALILNQYGHTARESAQPVNSQANSLPGKGEQHQHVLKEVESGRESAQIRGERSNFTTPEEKEIYLTRLNELKENGGMSRDDMERLAQEHLEQWRIDHDLPF